jgi:hypothetical protein
MKAIFTLLLATTVSSAAFAIDEGRITITVAAQKNVLVTIDGRQFSDDDNAIVLNGVQPGNHTIKVYKKVNRSGNGRNQSGRNSRREELIYSSSIYVRPSTHVDIVVNRFGKALVDERAITTSDRWEDDYNDGGYEDDYSNGYNRAMSEQELNQLVQKIKSSWFNSGKINLAKDALQREYFQASQVRQILQLFSVESDKLELAKLAYRNTVDKRSYYRLYDVFTFQSSKDELNRFTREQGY